MLLGFFGVANYCIFMRVMLHKTKSASTTLRTFNVQFFYKFGKKFRETVLYMRLH